MDGSRFDDLARTLAHGRLSRRRFLKRAAGGLVAGVAGGAAALLPAPDDAQAACKGLGRTCLVGRQCCSGTCILVGLPPLQLLQCACPPGSENCQGTCKGAADYQSDPQHCGGCGLACAEGAVCAGGTCQCPFGTELCGDRCVANCPSGQFVDPATCGCVCGGGSVTCGASAEICCEPGQGCEGGACCAGLHQICHDLPCCSGQICQRRGGEPNLTCRGRPGFPCASDADCSVSASGPCCGGVCLAARDPANCGACGRTCDAANPAEICFQGECCIEVGATCDPTGAGSPCCVVARCGNDAGESICCRPTSAVCEPDLSHLCCSGVCEDSGSSGHHCV